LRHRLKRIPASGFDFCRDDAGGIDIRLAASDQEQEQGCGGGKSASGQRGAGPHPFRERTHDQRAVATDIVHHRHKV
jgi:hypothetical protein